MLPCDKVLCCTAYRRVDILGYKHKYVMRWTEQERKTQENEENQVDDEIKRVWLKKEDTTN